MASGDGPGPGSTAEKPTFELSWVQAAASALAAITSAVLLSTVGVAGTLIGAAIGSLAATVGTAVYSYYLRTSRLRMALARQRAREHVARALAAMQEPEGSSEDLAAAEDELRRAEQGEAPADDEESEATPWREALRALPWKRIVLISAGLFVVAVGVLVVFELVAGGPVSSFTGGSSRQEGPRTSVPFIGGEEHPSSTPEPTSTPTSSGTETSTATSTGGGTESATGTATESPTPSRGEQTPTGRASSPSASPSASEPASPPAAPSPPPGTP